MNSQKKIIEILELVTTRAAKIIFCSLQYKGKLYAVFETRYLQSKSAFGMLQSCKASSSKETEL